ncbi:MAG TPA: sigma-70 family RNA polymerase sigma factor [Polyangiales bacterium]|nr:sigma-70 family RNA polymerase sigma factor [Polyangiales bacterium]
MATRDHAVTNARYGAASADDACPHDALECIASVFASQRAQLIALARRIVGDPCEAEDVVQSAFVRACTRASACAGSTNWGAWLQTVVRRQAIDHRRRQSRIVLDAEVIVSAPARECTADRVKFAELGTALGECKRSFRGAFELWYFEEMSYAEIANALGIPLRTVATRLHRAKALIRAVLGHDVVASDRDALIRNRQGLRRAPE